MPDPGLNNVQIRAESEDTEASEPPPKRRRTESLLDDELLSTVVTQAKLSPGKKKQTTGGAVLDGKVGHAPLTRDIRESSIDSLLSPSPSPEPRRLPRAPSLPPGEDLCQDDEDLYFARLVLSGDKEALPALKPPDPDPSEPPPFRVHVSGSARTEGYYKISHAEKSAYVAQYAARSETTGAAEQEERNQQEHVVSSRSNRANARRRAQGLEEMNELQRAIALSKGESAAADVTVKFNQLQSRKKQLRFARSHIHDWGLFAMERISKGDMVIEYVGEIIRAQVADKREKAYERQGIGSSYLFRIDEDLVVDATKKGNLGRLINHSCDPNCNARIITINGEKKIVIYAKQDIELGDEITYDYHFPIEQDKIPCLCGSAKCRGYLN
ncbi:SET domain-containing protein [Gloeophyllum trabeum ATCC 11539]|uniref:Histone-lysine N-methyltransferase, H3 lysine-4 specific n=1 Tax=Gloeophyllum trabeum (strain ATCC 11539 / FP-39264 / Madison 617) TaxID=670483 RepID=S7PW91_GLOTA|nr:SET domain-containing protein [Gloeophyllum trabeum ATCC 11539]EPQ51891.1 SET domain-containing protein [Gloeophyllum trabeum ATCC 11539]